MHPYVVIKLNSKKTLAKVLLVLKKEISRKEYNLKCSKQETKFTT